MADGIPYNSVIDSLFHRQHHCRLVMKIQLNVIRVQFEVNFCSEIVSNFSAQTMSFVMQIHLLLSGRCCKIVKVLKASLGLETVGLKLPHGRVQ